MKMSDINGKFKCKACYLGFQSKNQLERHRKIKDHKANEQMMKKDRQGLTKTQATQPAVMKEPELKLLTLEHAKYVDYVRNRVKMDKWQRKDFMPFIANHVEQFLPQGYLILNDVQYRISHKNSDKKLLDLAVNYHKQ